MRLSCGSSIVVQIYARIFSGFYQNHWLECLLLVFVAWLGALLLWLCHACWIISTGWWCSVSSSSQWCSFGAFLYCVFFLWRYAASWVRWWWLLYLPYMLLAHQYRMLGRRYTCIQRWRGLWVYSGCFLWTDFSCPASQFHHTPPRPHNTLSSVLCTHLLVFNETASRERLALRTK